LIISDDDDDVGANNYSPYNNDGNDNGDSGDVETHNFASLHHHHNNHHKFQKEAVPATGRSPFYMKNLPVGKKEFIRIFILHKYKMPSKTGLKTEGMWKSTILFPDGNDFLQEQAVRDYD
jgi:hypothetical protein